MRITKKIISMLLVVSMLASFVAMSGFEASAALTGQQKTDFGLHFDDTTRKFKVLQLSDIQTDHGEPNIALTTKETIRMAMEQYEPDLILLSGDQVQGGSSLLATVSQWKTSINAVFNTFTPYMKNGCKVVAVPGNHEYDFEHLGDQWAYYNSQSWYLDWDNNFSTVDLNGEPGAGNVTVSAGSGNKAVALNIALFNSKGDDDEGYLRPGGDDNAAYQQIVDWYTNTNNTLASSAYSYKAQVTGKSSAYVPAFGMQHVILQEIYNAMEACGPTDGGITPATDGNYSALLNASYMKFKGNLTYTGVLGEAPCPSTLGPGATTALYNALVNPGNFLGMCFGHDHLNTFDITDANGFRFLMGGALTTENYNNGNPNVRYMEFTLDDATGDVDLRSEIKSFNDYTSSVVTDVAPDRIEAINGNGVQLINTLSVPKTVYIGSKENNNDPRAIQKKGDYVQPLLLDYVSKNKYEQKLDVNFCLPAGATLTEFSVKRNAGNGTAVTMDSIGTETTAEGTLHKYKISTENALSNGETLLYTVKYTTADGKAYEIYSSSAVEYIKMPAGYTDWFRSWRRSNNSSNYCDLHYVSTLSGANAYSFGRDTDTTGDLTSNIHYNYSSPGTDVDSMWVNHHGDDFYSMYFWSPSRVEETSLISRRSIYASPQTDIYLDVSALKQVGSGDTRLDTGVRIDFWMPMNQGRGFTAYAAGIGFYAGDQDFVWNGTTTVDPNDAYSSYDQALDAEENSMSSGTSDDPTVFLYNSYAGAQNYKGLGTTHVNHNNDDDNKIGNLANQTNGWPLVVDSEAAALALNNVGMTMFTGVRVRGADSNGARQLNYAIAPFYLMFHTFDKGDLRELTLGELMNPRIRSDYPNATDQMWDAYISAYKNAVVCYAQTKSVQTEIDSYNKLLNDAIVALLNSNKGKPDESNLLKNTSKFGSIAVPPIIYVSGTTIQTADPYTDRAITFDVPSGATNVSCIVVNAGNDNVNPAVTLTKNTTNSNGTHYQYDVTGGTASAGGAIYYKLSYTLPEDKNKDGANDTYTQYAASYVKGVPKTEGLWVTKTRRNRASYETNSRIHIAVTLSMGKNIFASSGVSGIMSLYGGVQGTSFHTTVVNDSTNEYTRYGSEGVYWGVGTANQWPLGSNTGYAANNRVFFYNDRAALWKNGDPIYWNGLKSYHQEKNEGKDADAGNNTDEYIVANIYFDPQAAGASIAPRFKLSMTTADGDCDNPTIYQYWDAKNYRDIYYGGDYTTSSVNASATNMFKLASTNANNNWSSGNGISLGDGAVWETYIDANNPLSKFTATETYSRLIVHGEKLGEQFWGDVWNNSTVGFAFIFNRVDKSKAHEAINWINGTTDLVAQGQPSALFVESEMDSGWWSQWRTEVMKAYIECGNLWDQKDYDQDPLVSLWKNPIYKDADYSKLIAKINEITTAGLTLGDTEHILDYNAINYKVNSGDDSRYVGNDFARTMYVNNAADLIATIKNRTSVYGDVDKSGKTVNEANRNFNNAHLDIRFQGYIDNYVTSLQQAWDKLRLQNADYTAFDKFTNYYNSTNDTILFMRDDYAGFKNDEKVRNDANEKNVQSAMFTAQSRDAFVSSLNIDRTLKKPSEKAVVGSLPQIYPLLYTYKNVDSPDTTVCYYNTARDAYEGLEFRRAAEYYSDDGTYTETYKDASGKTVSVTYTASYNKFDRGNSYYYTPVFKASNNSLTADITNGGYAVTDAKVAPTYNAGNTSKVPVTDGTGKVTNYVTMYTEASWGGNRDPYGFADAYVDNISDADSTYKTTNSKDKWVLAYYVESQICQQLASVDYFYDKLKANVADLTQLNIEKGTPAMYEKGTNEYNALAGYEIIDENGNVLTDGAQWYTADTWAEYIAVKQADGTSIPDGATLAEAQEIINTITQTIYQKRDALVLRPMEDYRVKDNLLDAVTSSEDLLDMSKYDASKPEQELPVLIEAGTSYPAANNFTAINNIIAYYNTVIGNKYVGVFGSRFEKPQLRDTVENNTLLFKKHYYYKEQYRTNIAGKYAAINGYAGQPMASNIKNYVNAINEFKTLFDQREQNLNAADYSTVSMLLNTDWVPAFDTYGSSNYDLENKKFIISENYSGADWYTAESWTAYFNARETAAKLYESNKGYDGYLGITGAYGKTEAVGNLLVDSQGSNAINVQGSVNKAAYDLLVAYYRLEFKKVSEFGGTIDGVPGTGYADINLKLDELLAGKANEKVKVVILDENDTLQTVEKSVYGDDKMEELQTLANTIAGLANDNLGDSYNKYVDAVKDYKNAIDSLEPASVYLDGWDAIMQHIKDNAGDLITNVDSGTMALYFNAIYGTIDFGKAYAPGGVAISTIFSNKGLTDRMKPKADPDTQSLYNDYVTWLYHELKAIKLTPTQVQDATTKAVIKLSKGSQPAYDPLQLNGRTKVTNISAYTSDSVAAAQTLVKSISGTKISLWDVKPSTAGFKSGDTIVDGSLADEIWAAVGLENASGTRNYETDRDEERYLLVEGGQFLDALNDAVTYAKGVLYEADGVTVKQYEVLAGDRTSVKYAKFTDKSVDELVTALEAAAAVTDATPQADIDQIVFNILENTDIDNTIFLLAEDGTFYGSLNNIAKDEGLKYAPADYTYFNEELATTFPYESDGAQVIVDMVWLDEDGDGVFELNNDDAPTYFNNWTNYFTTYTNAIKVNKELTANDQEEINEYTVAIYDTRNALTWKGIDQNTKDRIDAIRDKIEGLENDSCEILTFINSKASVLENGTRVLTAPDIVYKYVSPYGDVSELTSLWATFNATYLETEVDITKQAEMLVILQKIENIYNNLETKKFNHDPDNEFTEGIRNLVDDFIAGTYDLEKGGEYTPDYQTVAKGTNVSALEQQVRNEQRAYIQSKLDALRTIINAGMEVGDPYQDYSTGYLIRYETAMEAVNAIAMELYEYLTTTPAQYAGFGLDMRQELYDYLSTEIVVKVSDRISAKTTIYTKTIPMFNPSKLAETKETLEGDGTEKTGVFGDLNKWPTINQLDESVGIEITENTPGKELSFKQPVGYNEETGETEYDDVWVGGKNGGIVNYVNGYSYLYSEAHGDVNNHHTKALNWLMNEAIVEDDGIYILADPNGSVEIDGAEFFYTMEKAENRDGEWYNKGYGFNLYQDGKMYYLAEHDENEVTGSDHGGWFDSEKWQAVIDQRDSSQKYLKYSKYAFGEGPAAIEFIETLEEEATNYGVCWNKENREAYVEKIRDDQEDIDKATVNLYKKICSLTLLTATDAYRYVAGLIYDALGLIPKYSDDNLTGIIISDNADPDTEGSLTVNKEYGGRVFNTDLLEYLAQYKTVEDEDGNTFYYSTQLPGSYNGGVAAVEAILVSLQSEIDKDITIDRADAEVLADTNSVKSRILTQLKALTLSLADLSKITSLVTAFLYNNPANENALGSYDIDDDDVGTQFFDTTHPALASGGNAAMYRQSAIAGLMQNATGIVHASGFYDFSKYTDESLRAVITFLAENDIITTEVKNKANGFSFENKTGFDIKFNPKTDGDTLYNTPATQQSTVDAIYQGLVAVINAMELQPADTVSLNEDIVSANDIMLNADIYDQTAVDNSGKNIWAEFVDALRNANGYSGNGDEVVTVINQNQVLQAEDRLEKAIKALVLYVDSFAPIATVYNTPSDIREFYNAHAAELSNTIDSADDMVAASYVEPGLGGYTLYVYTNKLNPHIVVSLKDTTNIVNDDGSTREVTASKPEKINIVGAMTTSGVTASVITPELNATTGTALTSKRVTIDGSVNEENPIKVQAAKDEDGKYDEDSSAYIILNPKFKDVDGEQQAVAYSIQASDSAVTKVTDENGEVSLEPSENSIKEVSCSNDPSNLHEAKKDKNGNIQVFVYYLNAMPEDGNDSGFTAKGDVSDSTILTYAENKGLASDEWNGRYGLLRRFNSAVKNWEFSDIKKDLNSGAYYIDPTFGEKHFGSFIYKLDPAAGKDTLDYDISKIYFEEGADAAKAAFISALKSNEKYINAFDEESKNPDSTKYIPFGAYENWDQHMSFIDNGTLLFAHVADRFGNVCNRFIEVKNYDQYLPEVTAVGKGAVSVTEHGGSGVAKVDLFEYRGTYGSSLYIKYLFDMLHVNDFTYVSENNAFTIKAGAASAGKLFTVAVTDNAGNVGSVPVYADENGDIVVSVDEKFENVAKYTANATDPDVDTGEDTDVIEFVFNSSETIKLNYFEPSSIVKAGPDGNVFANKKNVPLDIVAKSEVEAIKLYNVATATEEIWTADNATVKDNGNGTKTWTVKYNFAEGEYNYIATAKVDGNWETFGVDFSFEATTKSVLVKLTVEGIGKISFGYNEGNYSNVPVMSQKTVPYGSVVTLESVQTEEGSDFYYWINNGSNRIISAAEEYKFTAVTTMDLTAQFTTNECFNSDKKLVVYVNNAENVIENFELADGENYKVPAAPSLPDHVFKSWSMTKDEVLASDEMMIVVRPVYSLVVKNTVTLTEGNWTTTGAGVYESIDNERALVTISASATDNAGAAFLYWLDAETGDIASYNRTYSFHAIKDTELTPVYGDASAVVPAPVARISTIKYDTSAKKVNFYAERSIPADYELIQTGIVVTKTASVGNDEAAFVLDAAGVGKGVSKSTAANGFYTGAVSATAGTTVYARAYVIYMNADGDIITSYSPIASYTA